MCSIYFEIRIAKGYYLKLEHFALAFVYVFSHVYGEDCEIQQVIMAKQIIKTII